MTKEENIKKVKMEIHLTSCGICMENDLMPTDMIKIFEELAAENKEHAIHCESLTDEEIEAEIQMIKDSKDDGIF